MSYNYKSKALTKPSTIAHAKTHGLDLAIARPLLAALYEPGGAGKIKTAEDQHYEESIWTVPCRRFSLNILRVTPALINSVKITGKLPVSLCNAVGQNWEVMLNSARKAMSAKSTATPAVITAVRNAMLCR